MTTMTAPGVQRASGLHYGCEVEGRLKGLLTLFVHAQAKPEKVLNEATRFPHVFFNPGFLVMYGFECARDVLDMSPGRTLAPGGAQPLVTLCVTPGLLADVPDDLRERCHLMLTLTAPEAARLKPDDEVRLLLAPYDNLTAPMRAFVRACEADYAGDVALDTQDA